MKGPAVKHQRVEKHNFLARPEHVLETHITITDNCNIN